MAPLFQSDPYLTQLKTTVVSCTPAKGGYAVVLEDTVLYAESGGQPSDCGSVAGLRVISSTKGADGKIVHMLEKPLEAGSPADVRLDWARRFDHMQQHTAQHLLTAIAQDRHGLATTAFHLGAETCDIEVDSPMVAPAVLWKLESEVNELIRADLRVSWREVQPAEMETLKVRTRGLPEGFSGLVRLVEIDGTDLNTCGGTHVSRTADLQAVKIVGTEPMRGGTRINYLAGGRVLGALGASIEREKALTSVLSCGPAEHPRAAQKILDDSKTCSKSLKTARAELASHLGASMAASGKVASLHRPEADMEFLRATADAASKANPGMLVLLTAGAGDGGIFLLSGPDEAVAKAGPLVASALEGRGGGGRGQFQGKTKRPEDLEKALKALKDPA